MLGATFHLFSLCTLLRLLFILPVSFLRASLNHAHLPIRESERVREMKRVRDNLLLSSSLYLWIRRSRAFSSALESERGRYSGQWAPLHLNRFSADTDLSPFHIAPLRTSLSLHSHIHIWSLRTSSLSPHSSNQQGWRTVSLSLQCASFSFLPLFALFSTSLVHIRQLSGV